MRQTPEPPQGDGVPDAHPITSLHVRRARAGDRESLSWVVAHFAPLLLAQAEYRLGPRLRALYDPEDVVAEVWAIALPRLAQMPGRDGRSTPALLRFLSTTVALHVNGLVRRVIRGAQAHAQTPGGSQSAALAGLAADTAGVVTRVVRAERQGMVLAALQALDPLDREVIVLRGIEQIDNATAAALLGLPANTVSHRYGRALARLRDRLSGSVLDELSDD
jgi:DNA-directed RNA polymerase specialized sigma24 family protein